jgi:polyferredoxin
MKKTNKTKVIIFFAGIIVSVITFSIISSNIWGGKPEKIQSNREIIFNINMTVAEFGQKNQIPDQVLRKVFRLEKEQSLEKRLSDFGLDKDQILVSVNKALAIYNEQSSKNWIKIFIKFASWFVFLYIIFVLTRKSVITPKVRNLLYVISIILFGIVLGSDPSPMGTIKDAIVLFGINKVIFFPRMAALLVFLVLVLLANKYICSWGCQFGVLQDLIFRINRNDKKSKGIIKQYKPSFLVTNTIRIIFFVVFTMIAFIWAMDLVEWIDPFKIYNPSVLSYIGWIFIGFILVLSLFIYRPWCHLFCPFGLVGWLLEKVSIYKITVNYETCTACQACAKACPSTVMDAILRRENIIPDCFTCSSCLNVCPSHSVGFRSGKRVKPPEGFFKK